MLAWDWEGEKRRGAVGEGRREKGEGRREKGEGRREKGEGRRIGRRNGREEKRKKQINNTNTKPTKPQNQSPPLSKIQTMPKNPQTTNSISPHPSPKATAPKQHLSRPSFPQFPKPSS